jgi:hypothetical protein
MNTAIPTPFDIIDPAPAALVPTGLAWTILAACTLVAFLYILFRRRAPGAHSIHTTLRALLDELQIATAVPYSQQSLERVTRLARRILTPYISKEAATLSCNELRSMAVALRQGSDERAASLAALLMQLAEIEEHAYAPQAREADGAKLLKLQGDLIGNLETHVRRFRPS